VPVIKGYPAREVPSRRAPTKETMSAPIRIGIIGCGYWGPNLVRNFLELEDCRVRAIAEIDERRLEHLANRFRDVRLTRDYRELLADDGIDAVVVATNLAAHYPVARDALAAGKHVLVEKPLTDDPRQALELVTAAEARGLVCMTGHTFLFNQAILDVRRRLAGGELGKVLYLHTQRTNLGPVRGDTNVVWDLAAHDVSVFLFLLGEPPVAVTAQGGAYLRPGRVDVTFVSLRFASGAIGNIHVSWLDPCKVRKLTVIGDRKMLLFNDLESMEPIRIFDKGMEKDRHYETFGEFHYVLRDGDILIPKITLAEPLKGECAAFLEAVRSGQPPVSDGRFGLEVVRVLAAIQDSLDRGGLPSPVER
jgi:predicted dehydrogenase